MSHSVALCIPTHGRSELVRDFLESCADYYIPSGVDIYYYDSSADRQTEAVVTSWKDQEHVHYIRMEGAPLGEKLLRIFQGDGLRKEYDFLWLSNDATQFIPSDLALILQNLSESYDFIEFDNFPNIETRVFTDPDELLGANTNCVHIGASVMNVRTMLRDVDWSKYEKYFTDGQAYNNNSYYIFYFVRFLELNNFHALHLRISGMRVSPLKKSTFYSHDLVSQTVENTVAVHCQLPVRYSNRWKSCAWCASMIVLGTFSDILLYRREGFYSLRHFIRYWSNWDKVTSLPRSQLFIAAILPRRFLTWQYEKRKQNGLKRLRDFCERHKKIAIYGAGTRGNVMGEYMELHHIPYDCYCVTSRRPGKTEFRQHPVRAFSEIDAEELKDTGFVLSLYQIYLDEVLSALLEKVDRRDILYDIQFDKDIRYELGYRTDITGLLNNR